MLCLLHSIKSALPHCRSFRSLERLTSMCSTFGTPSFPDFVTNSNKSLQLNWKRLINLWRQGNGLQKAEWTRNTQSRELCESWHLAILERQVMHGAFPPKYALLVFRFNAVLRASGERLNPEPSVQCRGPEDYALSGLPPSTCSVWVALLGTQDYSS